MEKLNSGGDILLTVHEAAEALQMKIDKQSYLLVNYESWAAVAQQDKESQEPDNCESRVIDSISDWETQNITTTASFTIPATANWNSTDNISKAHLGSWPRLSFINPEAMPTIQETKVYESASSLSLATFTSLLIEFVARLSNLVDAFEDLSRIADFKEYVEPKHVV